MRIRIEPGPLSGCVGQVMPSKSVTHRALICAAMCREETDVENLGLSQDAEATCRCLEALGCSFEQKADGVRVIPGEPKQEEAALDCGESGSTLRFLLPLVPALGVRAAFTGRGKLPERPLSPLYEQLCAHGADLSPAGVFPLRCRGQLTGGTYTLDGKVSSQFVSGLLMALPRLEEDSEIVLTGVPESRPYIRLTLETLHRFGIRIREEEKRFLIPGGQVFRSPGRFRVEADWSGAAFWLSAGALSPEGVACEGMNLQSAQGDREIVSLLRRFGAEVEEKNGRVCVRRGKLRGIETDAGDIPDLVPVLAAVAACAEGETRIRRIARLRLKESDRVASVLAMVQALGGEARADENEMVIRGTGDLHGGTVDAFGDHRIAMAAAVAAGGTDNPVEIIGAEAVNKSYPGFFTQLAALGGQGKELQHHAL